LDEVALKLCLKKAEVEALVEDLVGRGAVNRAVITKGERVSSVLWLTGVAPRVFSWKEDAIATMKARKRLVNAVNEVFSVDNVSHVEEFVMTRIVMPAVTEVVPLAAAAVAPVSRGKSWFRDQVIKGMQDGVDRTAEEIFKLCPGGASVGSASATARMLTDAGILTKSLVKRGTRHTNVFKFKGAEGVSEEPTEAARYEETADGAEMAAEMGNVRPILERETQSALRYAYYEDGSVAILSGETTFMIPPEAVVRLARFVTRAVAP
jgi:hypothetical protein